MRLSPAKFSELVFRGGMRRIIGRVEFAALRGATSVVAGDGDGTEAVSVVRVAEAGIEKV
jgi:hypothetical protein